MSIPFVVISGMREMGFDHMPFPEEHYGFGSLLPPHPGPGVALVLGLRKWRLT